MSRPRHDGALRPETLELIECAFLLALEPADAEAWMDRPDQNGVKPWSYHAPSCLQWLGAFSTFGSASVAAQEAIGRDRKAAIRDAIEAAWAVAERSSHWRDANANATDDYSFNIWNDASDDAECAIEAAAYALEARGRDGFTEAHFADLYGSVSRVAPDFAYELASRREVERVGSANRYSSYAPASADAILF